jgi:putrescine---pyruvate transaminase
VAEVRGGVGLLGAVALRPGIAPPAIALLARKAGVLVRPLGDGVAVSPPLTATPEHFELIVEALSTALDAVAAEHAPTG